MENKDQQFEKDLKKVFRRELRDSLKSQMKNFEDKNDLPASSVGRFFSLKTVVAIAASIVIIGGLFWWNTSPVSAEELFAQNFEIYENYARPTTRDTPAQTIAEQAYSAYDQGAFEKAVELFPKIESNDQLPEDKFYLALSNLALENTEVAIAQLEGITTNEYQQIAKWYVALAFIQNDNLALAEERLNQIIADQDHPYLDEAKQLLQQLQKI